MSVDPDRLRFHSFPRIVEVETFDAVHCPNCSFMHSQKLDFVVITWCVVVRMCDVLCVVAIDREEI